MGSSAILAATLAVATLRPAGAVAACVGDCGDDGAVTVNELITMVNIDLGGGDVSACLAGDADGDQAIGINEIIAGVNNALNGCGGSSTLTPTPTFTPSPTPTSPDGSSYVGDYHGTADQYGVRFHVDANGSAEGFLDFLTPAGTSVAAARWQAAAANASYPASGQANLTTGAYHLAGNFFGNDFTFMGRLPAADGTGGTLSVTVFGTTLEGTLSAGTGPTPTPECDAASLQMTFSGVSGTFNGIASNFTVERMNTAIEQAAPDYIAGLHEVFNSTFDGTECTQAGPRLRNIQIQTFQVAGGLAAGQSIPVSLSSSDGSPTAIVYYGEEGTGGDRVWSSSAGTVVIDAVDGSVVTLRVVGAAMTETAGAAAGSFTLDVSGQVNDFERQTP
jgi:hypothetical protein